VPDLPGGAALRTVAALANEAAFALAEGVASATDIDRAMQLGANYPKGPLAWADEIGLDRILRVLDALRAVHGDSYVAAPLLRQHSALGQPIAGWGRGPQQNDLTGRSLGDSLTDRLD
jgi:3-hydroxybutyryl-CoA dehydrogenase